MPEKKPDPKPTDRVLMTHSSLKHTAKAPAGPVTRRVFETRYQPKGWKLHEPKES